ncbi:MAG: family 20 glycosylhydrolase [Agriterribacter sp.]
MKRNFSCLLIAIICYHSTMLAQTTNLLPAPQKVVYGKNKFSLFGSTALISTDLTKEDRLAIDEFITWTIEHIGVSIATTRDKDANNIPLIVFNCQHSGSTLPVPGEKAGADGREAYKINIAGNKVSITSTSDAGLYYALQTLRQLIVRDGKNSFLPEVDIEDYPAFAYRGIMMDFAHGSLLTEAEIKRQIDFLAQWKINQYYFYNEVSIEMKGYQLMNYNAQYSQDQIRRIVAYGKEKHMDVIPFVNFYGHLHELLRLEKYNHLGIGHYGFDLDPRKPDVQAILKDWIKQYSTMFPSPFIHVGFDETWETERLSKADKTIQPKKLYVDHLVFVTNELKKYGKKVMVWTDISKNYPDIIASFPRDVIPVVWDYSANFSSIKGWIKPIVKEQLPFFIQSAVDGWAHLYPTETTWGNIDLCLKAATEDKAEGYITSVWTDAVQPLLRNNWMFMAYGSVTAWQNKPIEKNTFIQQYAQVMYPEVAAQMTEAFKKMAESQVALRKCMNQTQTHMWINPFLSYNLKHTNEFVAEYEKGRLAAELGQEALIDALKAQTKDSTFIKTMLVNCRQLSYTAMRFLWAKKIVDRWNYSLEHKGQENSWYGDITETPHGLIMDMLDYSTEIKEEYRQAWLSENIPYRLGTIMGRFDDEYRLWRELSQKVLDYRYHREEGTKPKPFNETFGIGGGR